MSSERFDASIEMPRRRRWELLAINDDLQINFELGERSKSCEISIKNDSNLMLTLNRVKIDVTSVTLCPDIEMPMNILPRSEIVLRLDANYVGGVSVAKISFQFLSLKRIVRSIRIGYHPRMQRINKHLFTPPTELFDAVFTNNELPDTWDGFIPSIEANYAAHFHNLLYVEEVATQKMFKLIYTQDKVFFGNKNFYMQNGRRCQEAYECGIYDLMIEDLFDMKPSLQPGDQVIARKHTDMLTKYVGVVIDTKEVDLVVIRFRGDFIATFNHQAYYVEFIPSRLCFVRQHAAIDLAVHRFGMDYLMPTEIQLNQNNELITRKTKQIPKWFNDKLNEHQKQAVENIIRGDSIHPYIIFGPPGTGKTTTLLEIILQVLCDKSTNVLITTPSNSVANLMTIRLIESGQIEQCDVLRLVSYIYSKQTDDVPDEIKSICLSLNDLQGSCAAMSVSTKLKVLEQIKNYRVVIGTPSMIAQLLEVKALQNHFTHAFIDEAGRCMEVDALIPMLLVGKMGQTVMAGDPMQMPPFVSNKLACDRGLSISILNRLIDCYSRINMKSQVMVSKLYRNYRSLPSILDYFNNQYYNGELIPMIDPEKSYEVKLLRHLNDFLLGLGQSDYGIFFINVKGHNEKDKRIKKNGQNKSWFNIIEANVIKYLVEKLTSLGLAERDLGVITPYSLQTRALKNRLESKPAVKVGTVEVFQGLERKVIVISTVRSCKSAANIDNSSFGFIQCPKRINVATSRARAMLIVVGQANALLRGENWKVLIEACKTHNTYIDFDLELLKQPTST